MFADLLDQVQANLFSPTGPVMARALCRQTESRIARLEPYLTSADSVRLHNELSLVALLLDRLEQRIVATPGAMEQRLQSRWLPGVRRGGRRERGPRGVA
jgi:hypothetical protein